MTKLYRIKEIFLTLQGEGAQTGRAAVFCRFAGCNLWTGATEDRAAAACKFCDTDFNGTDGERGGEYECQAVVAQVSLAWGDRPGRPYVVCTGGEPLLQLDGPLIEAFHAAGFEVAIETNGTLAAPPEIDWICVSPKAGTRIVQRSGHELKVVVPQSHDWAELEAWDFAHRFVQPMDGAAREASTKLAIAHCLERPRWRLSLQTHKLLGIP
ncbi:MAG: hypothetical protein RL318_2012 [Fibrobacterota bacterium]|jgi:7-carboxy-7-deazaguanine synthase (Cx14CxxC type)